MNSCGGGVRLRGAEAWTLLPPPAELGSQGPRRGRGCGGTGGGLAARTTAVSGGWGGMCDAPRAGEGGGGRAALARVRGVAAPQPLASSCHAASGACRSSWRPARARAGPVPTAPLTPAAPCRPLPEPPSAPGGTRLSRRPQRRERRDAELTPTEGGGSGRWHGCPGRRRSSWRDPGRAVGPEPA